ncbi:MAG TPA: hypothetical protein VGL00_15090 [Terracidiphilus sp.]
MTKTWFAVSALTLSLGATSGGLAARAYATPAPAQPLYGQYEGQGRWDEAPSEYRDAQRMGFRDGIEAARSDFSNHRHKDADDHDAYRHPRVERDFASDYRTAYREGYSRAMHHMREERQEHRDNDEPHF